MRGSVHALSYVPSLRAEGQFYNVTVTLNSVTDVSDR